MKFLIASVDRLQAGIVSLVRRRLLQPILRKAPPWLTPDHLSLLRIGCALPTAIFVVNGKLGVGAAFFVGAAILDAFDGELARMRHLVSEHGAFLDIFADKVLGGLTLICVFVGQSSEANLLSPVLFWSTLGPDLTLVFLWLGGRTMPIQSGWKRHLGANVWGKWKFVFQCFGIALLLVGGLELAWFLLWIAVGLAILSIVGRLIFSGPK